MNNLETVTKELDQLLMDKGSTQRFYTDEITKLQLKEKQELTEIDKEIAALQEMQKKLIGDNEEIETDSFIVRKKHFNPTKKSSWKIEKEDEEKLVEFLKQSHADLVNVKTTESVYVNNFKELIAEGYFNVVDGNVVDENGEVIPDVKAELKQTEIAYKIKER